MATPAPTPTPPPLPTDASTATKVAFTVGAGAFFVSPALLPYSTTASAIVAAIGGAALGVGGLIHTYWDHSA